MSRRRSLGSGCCGWPGLWRFRVHTNSNASARVDRDADGSVSCWGDDTVGQAAPPAGRSLRQRRLLNTCGVRTDGTVACWGYDADRFYLRESCTAEKRLPRQLRLENRLIA